MSEVRAAPSEDEAELQPPFDGNHVNGSGGYVFAYPASWTVRETGTLTELSSTDERIAISFGLGPSGGIEPAYEDFVSLIDETYDEASVRMVPRRLRGRQPTREGHREGHDRGGFSDLVHRESDRASRRSDPGHSGRRSSEISRHWGEASKRDTRLIRAHSRLGNRLEREAPLPRRPATKRPPSPASSEI